MSQLIDVNASNFQQIVIEGSADHYVVVDFWAPWCNPCKVLKPLLEQLAPEYGYTLAKIDTEQEQQLAAEHGIRGIPDVRLYYNGQLVDNFSGALPESEIRAFLEKYMRSALGRELDTLNTLAQSGDIVAAKAGYEALMAKHPHHSALKLDVARFLFEQGETDEGTELLSAIKMGDDHYDAAQNLLTMSHFNRACQQRDSAAAGVASHYAEGACAALDGDYSTALASFLKVVQLDKNYQDQAGRKAMLVIFGLLGSDDPMVKQYQRKLAMFMN
ncbi:co-chaperone YbbN [Ectothiorhodospiraceae bacterium BW-2]|nr:co-chaperone YbbN [Ectothiorhodospiraceae bacterium BW-2]